MAGIALLGGLIAFLGLVSWLTLGATNAIQQIYAALIIISGILGLVILAVAVGAVEIRNAIGAATRAAAEDRRQLFLMLRGATFTVKSAAQADTPPDEWVVAERGGSVSQGEMNKSNPLRQISIKNSENKDKQTTFIIAVFVISVFVGVIVLYLYIKK
jgi:hypothetical protein